MSCNGHLEHTNRCCPYAIHQKGRTTPEIYNCMKSLIPFLSLPLWGQYPLLVLLVFVVCYFLSQLPAILTALRLPEIIREWRRRP